MSKLYSQKILSNIFLADNKIPDDFIVSIRGLQKRNNARDSKKLDKWSIEAISNATSGELGELQNFIKKKYTQKESVSILDIEDEFADVILYLFLMASKLKIDLNEAIIRKFNKKQDERIKKKSIKKK